MSNAELMLRQLHMQLSRFIEENKGKLGRVKMLQLTDMLNVSDPKQLDKPKTVYHSDED